MNVFQTLRQRAQRIPALTEGWDYLTYVRQRFKEDRVLNVAASLSYTSLLAVVPLLAIGFAILSAFPVYDGVRQQVQGFVFNNFIPETGSEVQNYLDGFLTNTGRLTALGIVGLAISAILLLNTIETAFNAIFRVSSPRPLVPRLLTFWALLTVGPLLVGASLSLSTYIYAFTNWVDSEAFTGLTGNITRLLPFGILVLALMLFYFVIPNRPVDMRHAFLGALVSALAFLVLRSIFGHYLAGSTTYSTIYGALATIPLFLVWMFLTWAVVLLGAELTALMGDWRGWRSGLTSRQRPGARLDLALMLLDRLLAASLQGGAVSEKDLAGPLNVGRATVGSMLQDMHNGGYVENTASDRWVLSRNPATVSLHQFCLDLNLIEALARFEPLGDQAWHAELARVLGEADDAQQAAISMSLDALLAFSR